MSGINGEGFNVFDDGSLGKMARSREVDVGTAGVFNNGSSVVSIVSFLCCDLHQKQPMMTTA